MQDRDRVKLLHGPYRAPPLRREDRATCLYRGCDVVITSWTAARISWPRCRVVGSMGGLGLVVDEELLRAIRTESAAAIQHWWGVGATTVWAWRKAFGVRQWGTEGTVHLHRRVVAASVAKTGGKRLPRAFVKRREAARRAKGYVAPDRWAKNGWKSAQLVLLGTIADAAVAGRIGRTAEAVRIKRPRLGIPIAAQRRKRKAPARAVDDLAEGRRYRVHTRAGF